MRDKHLVGYVIGLQILIFGLSWIVNPAEQGAVTPWQPLADIFELFRIAHQTHTPTKEAIETIV